MYTFSSRTHVVHKVQNKSWLHADMTRKADKCTKMEYERANCMQFLRQCVGHFFIPTPLLPPRFSLTTCSSFLPFSFVGRNNFTEGISGV